MPQSPDGHVWPPLLTPFLPGGEIDYPALSRLIEFYIEAGVSGLLILGLSGEPYELTQQERRDLVHFAAQRINHRLKFAVTLLPSDLSTMRDTANYHLDLGATQNVLMASSLVPEAYSDREFSEILEQHIDNLPGTLGMYEAPIPYKRIIGKRSFSKLVQSGRFSFFKDTCQDDDVIIWRGGAGETLELLNAEVSSLSTSLKQGYKGFCGLMANLYPEQIRWALKASNANSVQLMRHLTIGDAVLEKEYPASAKHILGAHRGLEFDSYSRRMDRSANLRSLQSLIVFDNFIIQDNFE